MKLLLAAAALGLLAATATASAQQSAPRPSEPKLYAEPDRLIATKKEPARFTCGFSTPKEWNSWTPDQRRAFAQAQCPDMFSTPHSDPRTFRGDDGKLYLLGR